MIHHGCRRPPSATGCHKPRTIQTVQPFPQDGPLVHKVNTPLPVCDAQLRGIQERTISYVVRTVKLNRQTISFEQHGSAPNFQGGVLTLCTCKHQMRACQFDVDEERPTWIAGFTGRTLHEGRHWLFYLAKIQSVHEAPSDLWKSLSPIARSKKSARRHFLGDLFEPKTKGLQGNARFRPGNYHSPPHHAHRQHRGDKEWHNDIHYYLAAKYGHPPLLVADPRHTYLFEQPMIYFAQNHCRNYLKWSSLPELLTLLRGAH